MGHTDDWNLSPYLFHNFIASLWMFYDAFLKNSSFFIARDINYFISY